MRSQALLTDGDVEAILRGEPVTGRPDLHELTRFVAELALAADEPLPEVGPKLAGLFQGRATSMPAVPRAGRPATAPRRFLAGAAAAVGGLALLTTGAAAADLLPRPLQDGVAAVVEGITPLDLPDSGDRPVPAGDPRRNEPDSPARVDGQPTTVEPRPAEDVGPATERSRPPEVETPAGEGGGVPAPSVPSEQRGPAPRTEPGNQGAGGSARPGGGPPPSTVPTSRGPGSQPLGAPGAPTTRAPRAGSDGAGRRRPRPTPDGPVIPTDRQR